MSADFLWPDKRFEALVGPVSRETGDKLHLYQSLLERWQKKVNLVSASTLPQVWNRHFLDSAQLIPHLPAHPVQIMDMGSGAGFPGLILAILTSHKLHLVESDMKKAIFLQEVARQAELDVTIHNKRIEAVDPFGVEVLTARALAPLKKLLSLSQQHHHATVQALFLKGRDVQSEIDDISTHDGLEIRLYPSITDPDARIVHLTGF